MDIMLPACSVKVYASGTNFSRSCETLLQRARVPPKRNVHSVVSLACSKHGVARQDGMRYAPFVTLWNGIGIWRYFCVEHPALSKTGNVYCTSLPKVLLPTC